MGDADMKCEEVIQALQQQAEEKYACDWDNVGLLVGSRRKEVKKIYIALDATDEAVQEAVTVGADLLLTHHPLIFRGMKRITDEDFIGRRIMAMIKADLSYYAMHTNFDVMGMADLAAEKLKLNHCVPLEVTCMEEGNEQGIGRVGELEKMVSLAECCQRVKSAFELSQVAVFGKLDQSVKRVALCPGSGKSTVQNALEAGADVYITGDIDHHTGIDAVSCKMAVIDAGHYGIEHIFIQYMKQFINKQMPDIEAVAQMRMEPFQIL